MRWASHLFRQALRQVKPVARPRKSRLRFETLEGRDVPAVDGLVFLDLNLDGIQDDNEPGVANVRVTGTDAAGVTTTTTTDEDGFYGLDTDSDDLKIVFSEFPADTTVGRVTETSGAVVRFLDADSDKADVNLALTAPSLITSQFFYDHATLGFNSGEPAVLAVPYGGEDEYPIPTVLATVEQVGSVWGLTYQASSDSVFASSFVKRHAGLGPNANGGTTTGGIYKIARGVEEPEAGLLIDLMEAGDAYRTGADTHPITSEDELDEGAARDWYHDADTLPQVGKRGLGGMQISPDGRTLYVVNLLTRSLIEIPITPEGNRDTSRQMRTTQIPLTDPTGALTNFNSDDLRPFAVAVKGNAVFVGVTYTAESSQQSSQLRAFVYAYDPATRSFRTYNASTGAFSGSGAPTPMLTANLSYSRGIADDPDSDETGDEVSANWRPWTASFNTGIGQEGYPVHPEPWLTDIVFDGDAMVLGLRDRFGDQGGFDTGTASIGNEDPFAVIAVGDILRATIGTGGNGRYLLESGGKAGDVTTRGAGIGTGPGSGEFYVDNSEDRIMQEFATGGLAQVPGFSTVATTGTDPVSSFSGGIYVFGNRAADAGELVNAVEVYESFDNATFGSSNGLGDLEAVPGRGTAQIGSRLFADTDGDGIQEPGEKGIAGVTVTAFRGTIQVGTTTTADDGTFTFDLLPETAYEVRVAMTQPALAGMSLAPANVGGNDTLDSDLTMSGTNAVMALTTGREGTSAQDSDGGVIVFADPGTIDLGDLVFRDLDNDGLFEPGATMPETGIDGVVVQLIDSTGTVVDTTTTAGGGLYLFGSIDPGSYRVRIAASNFAVGGALSGFTSSADGARNPDPNNDVNNDDNGQDASPGVFIQSGVVTLELDREPIDDGDTDPNTNLTVDFGFVPAATPVTTIDLGNRVWTDANGNGLFDTGETGIDGVLLELLDSTGTAITGRTTTTAGGGLYVFADLVPGTYAVRVAASNFNTGGALFGYTSSVTTVADPENNVDNDDNGVPSGTLGSGGFVASGNIVLTADGEPDGTPDVDGDSDANTNLTLDFGFVAPVAPVTTIDLGNRVWTDTNGNGLFDTGETGIDGVLLELLDSTGTAITGRTTTTAGGGLYVFAALTPGTYAVRVAASNFNTGGALFGYTSSVTTVADPENNVDNDDNGVPSGTLGSGGFVASGNIVLTADGEPDGTPDVDGDSDANTNLTLDFGFVAPVAPTGTTLGNLVFRDLDNDGQFEPGATTPETGIDGVVVELLNQAGDTVLATATTAGGGLYSFPGLVDGGYRVRIAASNFNTGGALVGTTSSSVDASDADDNTNNDDNGVLSGTLGSGGFVVSSPIFLSEGGEPINDGDTLDSTNLSLDFGFVPATTPGTIAVGDLVWNDANNNGVKDPTETGINGVTVQLLNAAGTTVVQTTTTAGGGLYRFLNVAPGEYLIRLAASNFQTTGVLVAFAASSTNSPGDPDDNANDVDDGYVVGRLGSSGFIQSGIFSLTADGEPTNDGDSLSTTNLSFDFGVLAPTTGNGQIGDQVFRDADNDGIFDTTETGVAGVVIELLDSADAIVASVITGDGGFYNFNNIVPGTYRLRLPASNFQSGGVLITFTSSTGAAPALPYEGSATPDPDTNTANNDDNGTTTGTLGQAGGFIQTAQFAVTATATTAVDFGVVPGVAPGNILTLGDRVWADTDNDGIFDAGESGIAGVFVQLINSTGVPLTTVTTDANGRYTFANIAAGTYRVRLTAANFTGSGVLVGYTSSTGANGAYEGASAPNADLNVDNDDNGSVSGTLGGTGFIQTGTITLSVNGEPDGDPQTDGDTDANTNLTLDLGLIRKFSLGNTVFNDLDNDGTQDANETGLANVVVRLLNPDNEFAQVATVTTNASGQYLFTNLAAGNYVVELSAANFNAGGPLFAFNASAVTGAADKQNKGTVSGGTLGSGGVIRSATVVLGPTANAPTGETPNTDTNTPDNQSNLTIDFGLNQATPSTGSLAGRVFLDYNNNGNFNGPDTAVSGVTITLTGGNLTAPITLTTAADGTFRFTNLAPGTYTLTETQPTTPANQTGKNSTGNAGGTSVVGSNVISGITLTNAQVATGYTFAEVPLLTTGGTVFEDVNGNGLLNSTEPGIAGVTVTLTGTSVVTGAITPRTVTTGANGTYTFDNLTPGTYTITETQPATYVDGREQNGNPAANNVTNDRFAGIDLTTSSAASGLFNFGEVKAASIAGVVYNDVDDNGQQAATGEAGIPGITIRLTGTDDRGDSVSITQTTGANGAYSFTNLRPGTYNVIQPNQPAAYSDGKETAGTSAGVTTVNDRITGIALDSGEGATGYLFGERTSSTTRVDLVTTITPASSTISATGQVTLTYVVTNAGTATAAGVTVTLTYGGLTFVSTSSTDYSDATKIWTVGDLAAGASETITVVLASPRTGRYTASARAATTTSGETATANNRDTANVVAGTPTNPNPNPNPNPTPRPVTPYQWFLSSSQARKRR